MDWFDEYIADLKAFIDERKLSHRRAGEMFGVSGTTVKNWLVGRNRLHPEHLEAVRRVAGLDPEHYIKRNSVSGSGNVAAIATNGGVAKVSVNGFSDMEKALANRIREIDGPEGVEKALLKAILESIEKKE